MKSNEERKKNPTVSQTNPAEDLKRDPRNQPLQQPERTSDHESSIGNTNATQMGMGTLGGQFDDERGGGTSGLQFRGNESPLNGDASSSQGDNNSADRFGNDGSSQSLSKENAEGKNQEPGRSEAK